MATSPNPPAQSASAAAVLDHLIDGPLRLNVVSSRDDLAALAARCDVLDDDLYTAPAKFGADVSRSLRRYQDLGVTQFILSDTPDLSEIERQGPQSLPSMREA